MSNFTARFILGSLKLSQWFCILERYTELVEDIKKSFHWKKQFFREGGWYSNCYFSNKAMYFISWANLDPILFIRASLDTFFYKEYCDVNFKKIRRPGVEWCTYQSAQNGTKWLKIIKKCENWCFEQNDRKFLWHKHNLLWKKWWAMIKSCPDVPCIIFMQIRPLNRPEKPQNG